jgi:hypothetical protein
MVFFHPGHFANSNGARTAASFVGAAGNDTGRRSGSI